MHSPIHLGHLKTSNKVSHFKVTNTFYFKFNGGRISKLVNELISLLEIDEDSHWKSLEEATPSH